ncbi:MAG: YcaO-like family protein [Chloroflexota bacterium]
MQATYTNGTHRLISPKETLTRIQPHLQACGITRLAEISGLDVNMGIPTFSAIRPSGLLLQTANGKGLTADNAKVSALMEAIEFFHAEQPQANALRYTSYQELKETQQTVIHPDQLGNRAATYFSEKYRLAWTKGENLQTGDAVWLPASAAYFCEPTLYHTTTNGLASGNHLLEATLHGLYELIERHVVSTLDVNGRLQIQQQCQIIDPGTIAHPRLQQVIQAIMTNSNKLILLWIKNEFLVPTVAAFLLNLNPHSAIATFNSGYGAHLDPLVAASRAITEAVQSRLTMIQGAREDIMTQPVFRQQYTQSSAAYQYFMALEPTAAWDEVASTGHSEWDLRNRVNLQTCYNHLVATLKKIGHKTIFRVQLTQPRFNIPVVKVIIPSLKFNRALF